MDKEPMITADKVAPVIDKVIAKYGGDRKMLISILFDVQHEFKYLPKEALEYLSKKMKVPLIDLYSIATFYKAYSLTPKGKHQLTVCLGTACHVRGALGVLEEIERQLDVRPGGTTKDKEFSLSTVACLGCCAMGPIVVIDDVYHGQVTPTAVKGLLAGVSKKAAGPQAKAGA